MISWSVNAEGDSRMQKVRAGSDGIVGLIMGDYDEVICFNVNSLFIDGEVGVVFKVVLIKTRFGHCVSAYTNPLDTSYRTFLSFKESRQRVIDVVIFIVVLNEIILGGSIDLRDWRRNSERITVLNVNAEVSKDRSISISARGIGRGSQGWRIPPHRVPIGRNLSWVRRTRVPMIPIVQLLRVSGDGEGIHEAEGDDGAHLQDLVE